MNEDVSPTKKCCFFYNAILHISFLGVTDVVFFCLCVCGDCNHFLCIFA